MRAHVQGTATTAGSVDEDLVKAESLSSALLIMTTLPWALCLIIFCGVYWSYPRDKARVEAAAAAAADDDCSGRSGRGSVSSSVGIAPARPRDEESGGGRRPAEADEEGEPSDRQRLVVVPVREE
jgi:hypothetical protein